MLRDYVNDHTRSPHVRLLSAISLMNLSSLLQEGENDQDIMEVPSDLTGERKSRASEMTRRT